MKGVRQDPRNPSRAVLCDVLRQDRQDRPTAVRLLEMSAGGSVLLSVNIV